MSAKASIPPGALAQNLLATIDASADPTRPPIHPDTLALYDLWLASGAAGANAAPEVPPAAPPPPPADQTATASDSAMESAPAPMESDEEQDDESVPEVPGTTI